jgi:hypothetical protein
MIMGNTDIPLPSDVSRAVQDPSIGIPAGSTLPESRSVLKDEIAVSGSPRSLTVLPAFGSKKPESALVNKCVATKRAVSWAEIVAR